MQWMSLISSSFHSGKVFKPRFFPMQALLGIALLLLLEPASCDDTVAHNIGGNMMYQLSKILSPEECHSFYTEITGREQNEVPELEQLSEENNPIHSRRRRSITNSEQCRKTLSHWLNSKGDSMYWDHLAQALQAIGRSDVSLEHLGKNFNQDQNLETEKDVEENQKMVQRQTSSLNLENKTPEQEQLYQDRESTKLLSDPGNLKLLKVLKIESPVPNNSSLISWLAISVVKLIGDFFKNFVLKILALSFFFNYLRRRLFLS